MRIPYELPQYEKRTLLIVSGAQAAALYLLHNGKIEGLKEFRIENPTYSDREGFFMRSGHGEVYGSGSVYEEDNALVQKKFLRELRKSVHMVVRKKDIDDVIVCAPQHRINAVRAALSNATQKKVREIIPGNHTKKHPLELLKYIKKEHDEVISALAEGRLKDVL